MFVSAPIPQLLEEIAVNIDNKKAREILFDIIYELESTDIKTRISVTQQLYKKLLSQCKDDGFAYNYLCFLSQYFLEKQNNRFVEKVILAISHLNKFEIQPEVANLLCGLFSSPMFSDPKDHKGIEIEIPEHIEQAMKYIRSEGYKVHVHKEE